MNLMLSVWFRLLFQVSVIAVCLAAPKADAHYCGPPVIRCKPGDIVTYYIVSDRAEQGLSIFNVFGQSAPEVAPVTYFTPIGRIYGLFMFQAQQIGTNNVILEWGFPANGASGFCFVEVRVSTNRTTSTAANSPSSAYAGDPVNTYTGELVVQEPPDLYLGGPLPLHFSRYYASRLQADALVNSRLGNNWSHNFEWTAFFGLTNRALVVSPQGAVFQFSQSGTNWILQSPTYLPFQLVNSGTNVIFGDPRDSLLYTFSTNGLLMSISDGRGNTHTLTYTEERLLNQVSDGLGRTLSFSYVGPQLLSRVTDGVRSAGFAGAEIGDEFNLLRVTNTLGRVTSYAYDNTKAIGSLLTSTVYPAGNTGYSQTYDSEGRVVQQARLGTNITRFAYATNSFTTFVTNAAGALTIYSHSPDGNLLGLTDASGHTLTVTTNAQGRRAGVTDRMGGSVRAAFDAGTGLPSAITNADGSVTQFTYTNRNVNGITFSELASVTFPEGFSQRFTYDSVGNMIAFQDRAGNVARLGYNARGQLASSTNSSGGATTMTYNPDGTLASQSDPELGMVIFGYDSLRRLTNAMAANGRIIRWRMDSADNITAITDERTNTTFFGFDVNNRLTSITNALGQVTRFSYDAANRLVSAVDRLGFSVSYAYDSMDRVSAFTNRNGHSTRLIWDSRGRLTGIMDPAGNTRSFGYNSEDLMVSFTNATGGVTAVRRDAAGFVTAITNALGKVTLLNRDVLHRVGSTLDPLGHLNQFGYEPRSSLTNANFSALGPATAVFNDLGRMTRLIDQSGSQWLFSYSPMGRLTNSVDPLNRTNSVGYDVRGRPLHLLYADGSSQTNTYDASGNLARLDLSGGVSLSFGYDAIHRLTNAAGLDLAYDPEDRVTNTASSGINFGAAYDPVGRLTNVSYNNATFSVSYSYDSRDRLVQVKDSLANAQINFLYDGAGRLTNVIRANGVHGIYTYDGLGRLRRIREGVSIDLNYQYDAAGTVASLTATAPLYPTPSAAQTNAYSYDAAHQLNSPGYGYDQRGRLIAAPGHSYSWNTASQLIRADGVTNTFNGAGNLLTRGSISGVTRFHYNHAIHRVPVMAEQNATSGVFQRYYIWSPDGRLLYSIDAANGNAIAYYHFDLNGSTLALTSSAGAMTDAYAYTPYGLPAGRTGTSTQPFTYVGRHGVRWDSEAQLYHMRARFYDPLTARFLSRDPLWPVLADPLSLNPYVYAANNPLQFIDPRGTRVEGESPLPVQVLGREDISRSAGESVTDVLDTLRTPPNASRAPIQGVSLRGLGTDRTLLLLNGQRVANGMDISAIPAAEIERVEVLKQGASAIHGSDAVQGVVNFILKKPVTEFDYLNLSIGNTFEPSAAVRSAYADGASEDPPAQPIRTLAQFPLFQLSTEMMVMSAYGAIAQRWPNGLRGNSEVLDRLQIAMFFAGVPPGIQPRGAAFVNGQLVQPKPSDLVYGFWLQWQFYSAPTLFGPPQPWLHYIMLDLIEAGGTGGVAADSFRPFSSFINAQY